MANIMDYLNWRGDLTFEESPLNEIDSLILANLSYVPLDGIVPSPWEPESISLKEASDAFWQEREEKDLLKEFSLIKMAPFAMRRMAATRRFGNLQLMYYQNSINIKEESQFSALCIRLGEGKIFTAFRGTDDTMIGWKENFRMCFETVPAQKKAVDYLNYVGHTCEGELWLGGHSKGGNLAVYAAVKARPNIQNRIQSIYNFDGPGFSKAMLASSSYQKLQHRIRKYVPTSSVVGMLLEQDENYMVVSSEEQGLRQHDPITWRVLRTEFVSIPERKEDSEVVARTMHGWIYSLSLEERKSVVDTMFNIIQEANIKTLNDFGENRWRLKLWQMQKRMKKNPDYHKIMKNAGHQMMEEISKSLTEMGRLSANKKRK